jgi:hypothetical protein
VNRNTEDLSDDLAWADLVMTSSMQSQQVDALDLIEHAAVPAPASSVH